jgi:hypothetical protein
LLHVFQLQEQLYQPLTLRLLSVSLLDRLSFICRSGTLRHEYELPPHPAV